MDSNEITRSLRLLWEQKPFAVVLLVLGVIIFFVIVVDTWCHKRRRKRPR